MYRLSDFDFKLPPELIAQHPAAERTASRLLRVRSGAQRGAASSAMSAMPAQAVSTASSACALEDLHFKDLLSLLHPGDLLVFNDSKVIPARLFGVKTTGGQVEILVERITSSHAAMAMLRVSKKPAPGAVIELIRPDAEERPADTLATKTANAASDAASGTASTPSSAFSLSAHATSASASHTTQAPQITVLGRDLNYDDRFSLSFDRPVLEVLESWGEIPLPPYIEHKPDLEDRLRYQTVYAHHPGSVAAPTAGLHFDQPFLKALDAKGIRRAHVTLHVGTGTFAPVRSEDIDQHQMHSEWCEISEETAELIAQTRREGGRVIAVGTTSLRTLESGALAPLLEPPPGVSHGAVRHGIWETDIFIRPGYEFKVVDALLTNFHLPKSTLLMLVAAFVGFDTMRAAYAHAIHARYRFFSYGDAMFCERSR
jgi:S-adenosylmethionine:tRNA ribosyltransferase-isomerase